MARKSLYECRNCGHRLLKWMGQCPQCGKWNSVVEVSCAEESEEIARSAMIENGTQARPLKGAAEGRPVRITSGFSEFDTVLGGGIVPGAAVVIGGPPGVGKSTLMLQVAENVSRAEGSVLYISGEESLAQIELRAQRLGISPSENLLVADQTHVHHIGALAREHIPALLILDSIQTVTDPDLDSPAGSVKQVQECSARLIEVAKRREIALFLLGHITKEGGLAGPKSLEHLVDTVVYFTGQEHYSYRMLRASKNRFGPTNELGIFHMGGAGLEEVDSPSRFFLPEQPHGATGSVVISALEGSRPLLVELQALVATSSLGTPYRLSRGIEQKRLALILAVLEKRTGYQLAGQDIYVNVAGGARVDEPAMDLGLAISVVSSLREIAVDLGTVVIGEVGLAGEVRAVSGIDQRLKEAARLGFTKAVVPAASSGASRASELSETGIKIREVANVAEAIEVLIGGE